LHHREELRDRFGVNGPTVAVVSGGNLDPAVLADLLRAQGATSVDLLA
jgi:hypothetical protein